MLQHKELIELIAQVVQSLIVLIGAVWAYVRFRKESPLEPRIEFDFGCEFLGPQGDNYLAVFTPRIHNRGSVEHRFNEIRVRVRGLKDGEATGFHNEQKIARFEHCIICGVNILPRDVPYFFVRPGVEQALNYVTLIPTEHRFIVVRFTFKYLGDLKEIHTAERVFEVKAASNP